MTVGRGACINLSQAQTCRRLKQWCVESTPASPDDDRQGHMALHRRPLGNGDEVFVDAMLLDMRRDLWEGVAAVVDV